MIDKQRLYELEQEIAILKKQEYLVVKANRLIQKSRYSLSLREQKALLYVISMIKPSEPPYQLEYEFDVRDFCKVCDLDFDNGGNYVDIKSILKRLSDRSMWLELEDGSKRLCRWLSKVVIHEGSGQVKVRLDEDLVPYLFGLKEQFTQYQLLQVLPMRSGFSTRLYEILKSYANLGEAEFEIDELKQLLAVDGVKSYVNFKDFRRYVLDVAVEEIHDTTDLDVSYQEIRHGRGGKIVKVVFEIKRRSPYNAAGGAVEAPVV